MEDKELEASLGVQELEFLEVKELALAVMEVESLLGVMELALAVQKEELVLSVLVLEVES